LQDPSAGVGHLEQVAHFVHAASQAGIPLTSADREVSFGWQRLAQLPQRAPSGLPQHGDVHRSPSVDMATERSAEGDAQPVSDPPTVTILDGVGHDGCHHSELGSRTSGSEEDFQVEDGRVEPPPKEDSLWRSRFHPRRAELVFPLTEPRLPVVLHGVE
jgi:hypothetical protein